MRWHESWTCAAESILLKEKEEEKLYIRSKHTQIVINVKNFNNIYQRIMEYSFFICLALWDSLNYEPKTSLKIFLDY